MVPLIIACEVGFWVLLLTGLAARYPLKARALSTVLLICVPLVDVVLLAASIIDLRRGGTATVAHGLAAIYIGVSVAFGGQIVRWADSRFAHRFAGGPAPVRPPKYGQAHTAHERRQWLRHLLAYAIAVTIMGMFTLLVGDSDRVLPIWGPMGGWAIALVIDFVVSFSYTLSPRKAKP
ncbi:membrane protein [Hamadaea tsunoensis]|uniref:membrane protein n=1 Tax=Hamadaea tsunoensis TaxID=53368 RepID=UPI0004157985|nr:membrane protein [Hamadaea tsunoensis]